MNRQEAKRYAHKIVGDAIMSVHVPKGPDRDKIVKALGDMAETHRRFGPRTGDRAPRESVYTGEKFAFDNELISTADHPAPQDTPAVKG